MAVADPRRGRSTPAAEAACRRCSAPVPGDRGSDRVGASMRIRSPMSRAQISPHLVEVVSRSEAELVADLTAPGTSGSNGFDGGRPVMDSAIISAVVGEVARDHPGAIGCDRLEVIAERASRRCPPPRFPPVVKNTRSRSPGAIPVSRSASARAAWYRAGTRSEVRQRRHLLRRAGGGQLPGGRKPTCTVNKPGQAVQVPVPGAGPRRSPHRTITGNGSSPMAVKCPQKGGGCGGGPRRRGGRGGQVGGGRAMTRYRSWFGDADATRRCCGIGERSCSWPRSGSIDPVKRDRRGGSRRYDDFPHLQFDRPSDGVCASPSTAPDSTVDADVHRELPRTSGSRWP